jgi:predicted glycoside hydrolase/deacetylase ChbG (UPF0249 family)
MKQLLIRADDIGYSYAVNVGIARSVNEGLVRSAGLMPNMPEAARGWSWVKDANIAIGQHTNLCLGTPCADPALIPSLLDERVQLRSSREYRAAFVEGREFAAYDELVIEIEAQLASFRAITGKDPDYFEAHAVQSANLMRAIHDVAEKHGFREQPIPAGFDPSLAVMVGHTPARMIGPDMVAPETYDPWSAVKAAVEGMADDDTVVMVFHPGYLDAFILDNSSLTLNRTRNVDMLIDPAMRSWLEAQPDLRLVDYRDL